MAIIIDPFYPLLCTPLYSIIVTTTFTACSTAIEVETEPHIYIALGDSVSSGYGLTSPTNRHTHIFYEMLRKDGYLYVEEKINKATESYTTTDLLELLNGMTDEQLRLFKNARIITLNIGGNNILVPFANYLSNNQEDITAEENTDPEGVSERVVAVWGVIRDTVTDVIGAGRALFGFFSPELEAALESGVQTFAEEFVEIINWIENHAPRATLIVNTIYNPIPERFLIIPVELSN